MGINKLEEQREKLLVNVVSALCDTCEIQKGRCFFVTSLTSGREVLKNTMLVYVVHLQRDHALHGHP